MVKNTTTATTPLSPDARWPDNAGTKEQGGDCDHDWQCLGRYSVPRDQFHDGSVGNPRSTMSAWLCFRCGKQRTEQWDW